jgi:hypothetical protein
VMTIAAVEFEQELNTNVQNWSLYQAVLN